ncbi:Centromere/kinetochore protein zw10-like protein [Thalictrum thalictroides]|uniref:Centromere/kinetochore protein zw10-like protein n=1 Tax=Thalictrum thalictroides TaxID=46969 RepID=A0A7J6WQB0_THATH|nr:Centromere/kinetochore protein zw10-like protein [Thalictrum thalictroides]
MDVLFGSIDVRELLSTSDFDESSPLSVPDLRLLIDRLQIRSLHIKEKVRDYVISHHKDFSEIFSHCSNLSSKTEGISTDVSNVLSLISDHPIDVEIRETAAEISSKTRELKEKKELLVVVQTIVNLVERLKLVKEDLKNGRLIEAAESMRGLKKALLIRDDEDDDSGVSEKGEPFVFGLLRKEWKDCFVEVQELLVRAMDEAVKFEHGNGGRVRVKFRFSVGGLKEVQFRTVLTAMEVIGVIDYGLAKVADLIVKFVVIPTVSNGSRFDFVEELDQETMEKDEAILGLVSSSGSQVDIPSIYSNIIQVIKFAYNILCLKNDQWMRCFGRLSWQRISELIIAHFLSKAVPDDASKLSEFQKIIELTSEFENKLEDMKIISASDDKDRRLSEYAQNIEVHFASRKKIEILAKARNLLLQCDFSLPPGETRKSDPFKADGSKEDLSEQVVQLLFLSERCIISKAGAHLMKSVHQTLRDVCLSSARVSIEFYHAARDTLLLYEAIIPIKLEKQLNSINQIAIIVHNDCLFLSQEILGLAFEYRSDFPSCLKDQAVFLDMAPRFHQMAEEVLRRQIQLISFNLKELQRLIQILVENLSSLFDSLNSIHERVKLQEDVTHIPVDELIPSLSKLRKLADLLDMPLKSITNASESGELFRCGYTSSEVENFVKAVYTDSPLRKECLWRIQSANW